MRPIILTTLTVALSLTGGAYAQQLSGVSAMDRRPGEQPTAGTAVRDALQQPATSLSTPAREAPVAGRQRPPRSEKAIGPDLMAYVFAPIGAVVNPIARDLHGVDAALAPINEALLPITGPLDPALFDSAVETTPLVVAPETVKSAKAGPRK